MTKKMIDFSIVFLFDAILLNNINVMTDIKNKLDNIYGENVNPIINQIPNEIINFILTKDNLQITILNKQLIIAKTNPIGETVDDKYFEICEKIYNSINTNIVNPKAYGFNYTYDIVNDSESDNLNSYLNKFTNKQININQITFSINANENIKYNLFNFNNNKIIANINVNFDFASGDVITNTVLKEKYDNSKKSIEQVIDSHFEIK